jgi:hypothetical protein
VDVKKFEMLEPGLEEFLDRPLATLMDGSAFDSRWLVPEPWSMDSI